MQSWKRLVMIATAYAGSVLIAACTDNPLGPSALNSTMKPRFDYIPNIYCEYSYISAFGDISDLVIHPADGDFFGEEPYYDDYHNEWTVNICTDLGGWEDFGWLDDCKLNPYQSACIPVQPMPSPIPGSGGGGSAGNLPTGPVVIVEPVPCEYGENLSNPAACHDPLLPRDSILIEDVKFHRRLTFSDSASKRKCDDAFALLETLVSGNKVFRAKVDNSLFSQHFGQSVRNTPLSNSFFHLDRWVWNDAFLQGSQSIHGKRLLTALLHEVNHILLGPNVPHGNPPYTHVDWAPFNMDDGTGNNRCVSY